MRSGGGGFVVAGGILLVGVCASYQWDVVAGFVLLLTLPVAMIVEGKPWRRK